MLPLQCLKICKVTWKICNLLFFFLIRNWIRRSSLTSQRRRPYSLFTPKKSWRNKAKMKHENNKWENCRWSKIVTEMLLSLICKYFERKWVIVERNFINVKTVVLEKDFCFVWRIVITRLSPKYIIQNSLITKPETVTKLFYYGHNTWRGKVHFYFLFQQSNLINKSVTTYAFACWTSSYNSARCQVCLDTILMKEVIQIFQCHVNLHWSRDQRVMLI